MEIGYQIFTCPFGELLVAGTADAVTYVAYGNDRAHVGADFLFAHDNACVMARNPFLEKACEKIMLYLHGKTASVDVPVRIQGTAFQRRVWNALCDIPYGKTVSYSALAEQLGDSKASRAVANACGDNPVPLIIPCHRVIHKNGDTSGFAWGADAKKHLLAMEKEFSEALLADAA